MTVTIDRHRTAMSRAFLSRPISLAIEDGVITPATSIFDYGCGRGDDLRRLEKLGYQATGWDPALAPNNPRHPSDVVNLGYVVNVIENPAERLEALRSAWRLAQRTLIVSARLEWEAKGVAGKKHADGVVTSNGTFQKFFRQDELRGWIEGVIGVTAAAAAPGIFYLFRSREDFQRYLAHQARRDAPRPGVRIADLLFEQHRNLLEPLQDYVRSTRRLPSPADIPEADKLSAEFGSIRAAFALIRRVTGPGEWTDIDLGTRTRISEKRFEQHQRLLQPIIDFVAERGRLPRPEEVPTAAADIAAEFGSVRAAFSLIRRVSGPERWAEVETRSRRDFLVYLALAAFSGRPRFSELPDELQYDVRDLFGNYKKACQAADTLLFATGDMAAIDTACRSATVGKRTPEALYVHTSALGDLPPLLRVYEGCGRALAGTVDGATLLKLHRTKAQVSYLEYPDFDRDPHPTIATVVIARLPQLDITFRDFRQSENPPILHRKETFVPDGYPGRDKFARLTRQEDRAGVLDDPARIGTRARWEERLADHGVTLRGHRLIKAKHLTTES